MKEYTINQEAYTKNAILKLTWLTKAESIEGALKNADYGEDMAELSDISVVSWDDTTYGAMKVVDNFSSASDKLSSISILLKDLEWDYQRMSTSGQATYDEIMEVLS